MVSKLSNKYLTSMNFPEYLKKVENCKQRKLEILKSGNPKGFVTQACVDPKNSEKIPTFQPGKQVFIRGSDFPEREEINTCEASVT